MVIIKGIKLAFNFKLNKISPRSKAINARCIPHPGHSIPNKLLKEHANKCCSKKVIKLLMP